MIRKLFLLVAALCLLPASVAVASPTGVAYTQDVNSAHVGQVVTYIASPGIVCDKPPCRYQWRVFGSGYSRLGTPIGEGTALAYSWSTVGSKLVQLKVTNSNGTNGFGTYQDYTTVIP